MSEFSTYEKMPNTLKKLGLSESDVYQIGKLKWVVTEKVHGANFSFVYENGNLKFAKRKEYLKWSDDFFAFQLVVKQVEEKVIRLFELLGRKVSGKKYILYGELFGGQYPHPEVAATKELQAIQTGVYYSPEIHFCAFDIAIETNGPESKYYLDYETSVTYFKQFELFYAKPLFIGKLTDALNFNTRINSAIPHELGMPSLEKNLIEGVVIKPFNKIDPEIIAARPIIKLKNPEFDEEDKYHEAEKWSFVPGVSSKAEDLSFIVDELRTYVTENRLKSAVSKIGAFDVVNEARMAEIKSEMLTDVLTDFDENNTNIISDLSTEAKDWVIERVHSDIQLLMTKAAQTL